MFNNVSCEQFKQDLTKLLNDCALPPVVAYYIMKDSLHELQQVCQQVVTYELNNKQSEQKKIAMDAEGNVTEVEVDQK